MSVSVCIGMQSLAGPSLPAVGLVYKIFFVDYHANTSLCSDLLQNYQYLPV